MSIGYDLIKFDVEKLCSDYRMNKPKNLSEAIKFIINSTTILVEIVETSIGIVKENKKQTVLSAMSYLNNQINIPWVPRIIQNWIFNSLIPIFIDFIVAKYNEKGVFKK